MNINVDELTLHARRCDAAWAHRYANVGHRDRLQAHLVHFADAAGLCLADRDQALAIVAATLVVDAMSVEMTRQHPAAPFPQWTVLHREAAAMPAQLTNSLLMPFLEAGPR